MNKDLLEQIHILMEQIPEYLDKERILKRLSGTKYKEVLREVLAEDQRKNNYIRIYPQKGTDVYDALFKQQRPMNRYVYKMLYTTYLDLDSRLENMNDFTDHPIRSSKEYRKLTQRYQVKIPQELLKQQIGNKEGVMSRTLKDNRISKSNTPVVNPSRFYTNSNHKMRSLEKGNSNSSYDRNLSWKDSVQSISIESDGGPKKVKKVKIRILDILIEYVERVINAVKVKNEKQLSPMSKDQLLNFITYPFWMKKDCSILV